MGIDADTRQMLWDSHRIAIHFKDTASRRPEDYDRAGQQAMRTLLTLADEGGYVCARLHPYDDFMLGYVAPDSEVEVLRGRYPDGRIAILKTVQLTKVRLVKPLDHAVLHVGRPRQGTIRRWLLARKIVENLVECRKFDLTLSDLLPSQQEILCSEILRSPQAESLGLPRLACLLLPPGRTMPDIDIIGLATDAKMLLAQVTFSPIAEIGWKRDALARHKDPKRVHLVLFCACEQRATQDGIITFPLQQAFDTFIAMEPGQLWLRHST
jgi:hypothetical protein